MTKVGGTARRNKFNPTRPRSQAVDASTSWTSPNFGLEVHIIINKLLIIMRFNIYNRHKFYLDIIKSANKFTDM